MKAFWITRTDFDCPQVFVLTSVYCIWMLVYANNGYNMLLVQVNLFLRGGRVLEKSAYIENA